MKARHTTVLVVSSCAASFGLFFIRPQSCDVKKRLARERAGRPAGRHQDSASKATPISGHLEAMPIYARSWSQLDSDLRLLSSSTRFWPRDQPHLSLPPTTTPTLLRPLVLPKNTNRGNGHGLKKISKRFLICNHFVNGIINM